MPKRVHFGGQVHVFPDSTTEDQIRTALGVKPPQAQQPAQPEAPGFFKRMAQSAGIPTSVEEMKEMGTRRSFGDVLLSHPAARMAQGYVSQLGDVATRAKESIVEGGQEYARTGNIGEAVIRGGGAALEAGVGAIPFIGQPLNNVSEDVSNKNYAGAAGGFLGVASQLALPAKLKSGRTVGSAASEALIKNPGQVLAKGAKTGTQAARSLVDPTMITADNAFIKATKPRNTIPNVREKVNSALPQIRRVADEAGIDLASVPDEALHGVAESLADVAAKQKWAEISSHLEANGVRAVSADPIAGAIQSRINVLSKLGRAENARPVKLMQSKIAEYRGQRISVSEMETRIQELNNKLSTKQGKLKVDEGLLRRDPRYAGDFAELDALRNMQDDLLSSLGESVRGAKKEFGSLKSVRKILEGNKNIAERASAEPLFSGLGRMAGAGNVAGGTWQMVTGKFGEGASNIARGSAQMAAGRKAALLNNRTFMLRQALIKTKPGAAPVMRPPFQPKGLLTSPTFTPPPADISGSVPFNPPAYNATSRAERLGLLLPENVPQAIPLGPSQMPMVKAPLGLPSGVQTGTKMLPPARAIELGPSGSTSSLPNHNAVDPTSFLNEQAGREWWKQSPKRKPQGAAVSGKPTAKMALSTPVSKTAKSAAVPYETGKPATIHYLHNTQKSPKMGARFGQDVEPTGRYINEREGNYYPKDDPRLETGTVRFENPLVVEFGGGYQEATNWKNVLSQQFGGKKGKALSDAIRKAGHDGIITIDRRGNSVYTSEIVDLTAVKKSPKK
jgi:hypothetical protein